MSFFLLFLSPTLAVLTPMAELVESLESLESLLSLCCFFFLSFMALLEGSESWLEVEMGALEALKSCPRFTTPWIWTLCAVI